MPYNVKHFVQNTYTPVNPHKLINKSQIVFKSSWEFQVFNKLDLNPNIIRWSYEVVRIKYIKPTDNYPHTYEVDIYAEEFDPSTNTIK